MNLIKIVGYTTISVFIMIAAIVGFIVTDFILFRMISQELRDPTSKEIIEKRFEQDVKLAETKRREGFFPLVYPDYSTSDNEYISLAYKYNIFPLGGLPNKKTYFCNEGYGLITYESDRFGFRNVDKKWDELNSNNSVLLIGDSFTHGACVQQIDTISDNLNSLGLGNINLAISSNSAAHYAALADEFIKIIKPKVVVITFYRNDRYGSAYSIKDNHFKSKYSYVAKKKNGQLTLSVKAQELFKEIEALSLERVNMGATSSGGRINPIGESYNRVVDGFRRHSSLPAMRYWILKNMGKLKDFRVGSSETKRVLKIVNDNCDQVGCEVIIVYLAESKFWDPDIFSDGYKSYIFDKATQYDFKILDTTNFINRDDRANIFAPKGPHYSPSTYKLIAQEIRNLMVQNTNR